MSNRILCFNHTEKTPSLVVSGNYYKCFGCGISGHVSTIPKNIEYKSKPYVKKTRDALTSEINEILALPKKTIRGLDLHYDEYFYYVVWPDHSYYKKRAFADIKSKYLCPKGATKPLFELPGSYSRLMIVEGEINALSAFMVKPDYKIVSPGGVSDFKRYLDFYLEYEYIYIVCDADKVGIATTANIANILRDHGKSVFPRPMQIDFNSILTTDGLGAVQRKIETFSGMQKDMRKAIAW